VDEAARPATRADLDELVRLASALRLEMSVQRGGADRLLELLPEPLDASFAGRVADAESCTVVGLFGNSVVGYLTAVRSMRRDGTAVTVVDELFVEAEARELGVAEAMLTAAIEWAAAIGCLGIDAVVLPGLRDGKNLFERFGMTARAIVVHRDLAVSDPSTGEDASR